MKNMTLQNTVLAGALLGALGRGPAQGIFRGRHHKAKLLRRAAKIARKAKTRRIGRLARAARKANRAA